MLKELIPKMGLRANIYDYILLEKQKKQQTSELVRVVNLYDIIN